MQKKSLILLLVLYIAATALSFGAFSVYFGKARPSSVVQNGGTQTGGEDQESQLGLLLTIPSNTPKDQICPLNGGMFTQQEKDAWSKRRPLAVMIENSPDARPQSGLSKSDLVFEAMAEGGVTRFMAFFYCDVQANDTVLAPIRSARQYFFELAAGFDRPLYVHVGGANTPGPADALGHIADAGWNGQNDMNQFSIGYPTFVRDYNRLEGKDLATEHTMVSSTEKLWKVAEKRGWTNMSPPTTTVVKGVKKTVDGTNWLTTFTPWTFQDGTPSSGSVNSISFEFWDGFDQYAVKWDYDAATNSYKRILAGAPHVDLNNNQQLMAKNAVVLFAEEKGPIDENKHMLYTLSNATGDALVFQNGTVVKAKWAKKDLNGQLTFTDEKGKPLAFVRGPIWVSIVAKKTAVTY